MYIIKEYYINKENIKIMRKLYDKSIFMFIWNEETILLTNHSNFYDNRIMENKY